jgi:hypothetical protein
MRPAPVNPAIAANSSGARVCEWAAAAEENLDNQ